MSWRVAIVSSPLLPDALTPHLPLSLLHSFSIAGEGFVGVQEDAGKLGPGSVFGGIELGPWCQAGLEEFAGVGGIGGEVVRLCFEEGLE
mgnify:CR=1 FL=1